MAADARAILKRQDELESLRTPFAADADAIRKFIMPFAVAQDQASQAESRSAIWDNTGELAAEVFKSGIYSLATMPGLAWFHFSTGDDDLDRDYEAAAWLDHASRVCLNILNSSESGFYTCQDEYLDDVGAFGNGTKFIWFDRYGRIRFDARPWSEMFIAEGADGRIDTWHRKFTFTARQAVQKWGGDRVGEKIEAASRNEPDKAFNFLQAVYPRTDEDRKAIEEIGENVYRIRQPRERMRFAGCIVSIDEKRLIHEEGFPEAPFVTGRWRKRSGPYGVGCGHRALHDVRSLQFSVKTTLRGAAKLVDPPLMIPDDGVGTLDMNPNAVNVYRSGTYSIDPIKTIQLSGRPDIGEQMNEGMRERINRAFYMPQFQTLFLREPRMTATEVLERRAEMRRLLNPMLGRLQAEDLEPTLARTLALAFRLGYLRPMPEVLRQISDFRIRFLSEAVQDQKLVEAAAILRTREAVAQHVASTGDPSEWDIFDADAENRHLATVYGVPQHLLRDPRKVAEIRAARQQEAVEQAEQAEAAGAVQIGGGMARAMRDMAKAQEGQAMQMAA